MKITREAMNCAHAAHDATGASRDFLRYRNKHNNDVALGGTSLVISPTDPLHLRFGPTGAGSVTIAIPPNTTISDLSVAMWFYPLPALILQILRLAHARGETPSDQDLSMIYACETAFLDCLVKRDWVKRFADYILTSPAWRAHRPVDGGPS